MSRTSVKSRRASRLPTLRTGGCTPISMRAICWAKLASAKVGACRGPAWLKGRKRIAGQLWLRIGRATPPRWPPVLTARADHDDTRHGLELDHRRQQVRLEPGVGGD